jgi:hypothetical protein
MDPLFFCHNFMLTLIPPIDMARTNRHMKGSRFKVNAGEHIGMTGATIKANPIRHWVAFDDGFLGFVLCSYCDFIKNELAAAPGDQVRRNAPRMSRLSNSSSKTTPILPVVSKLLDLSSADDNSTVVYGHDSKVTSQVLLHLLANSLANMQLDDAHIHAWMNQLRDCIYILCHGPF